MEVHLVDDRQELHPARSARSWAGSGFRRAAANPPIKFPNTKISQAYGQLTLDSIDHTDSAHPTVQPVPYTGVQFLAIPEFQDLGTRVSQQISAAIAEQKSAEVALAQSQKYAEVVGRSYQEKS